MKPILRALLLLCLFVSGWQAAQAEDWPRWRGPRGDGTWHAPALPERFPASLVERWSQPIGGGYAGVVVAGDRVIVLDRQTVPVEVERVLCYSADSGHLLWQHAYPVAYGDLSYGSGPRASATLDANQVFTLGALGHANCLDLESGEVLWAIDSVAQLGARLPEWGFAAAPVVWRDLVILHLGAAPSGCFVAVDRAKGTVVWMGGADPAGYANPVIVERPDGPLLVGWSPENVLGLAPESGEELWKFPYKVTYGVSIATPIVRDDIVFVTGYWEGSKAIRLGQNRADAELAWEDDDHLRGLMSQPLYREGLVYSLDKILGVTCFDLRTGGVLWTDGNKLTPRGQNPQVTMVWLGDSDRTINLNAEGELVLARMNRAGFSELDRRAIIDPTWAHPAYAGNRVYARSDTKLVCVELPAEGPPAD